MIRSRSQSIDSIRSSSIRLSDKQAYPLKLQDEKVTENELALKNVHKKPAMEKITKKIKNGRLKTTTRGTVTNYSLEIQIQTPTK